MSAQVLLDCWSPRESMSTGASGLLESSLNGTQVNKTRKDCSAVNKVAVGFTQHERVCCFIETGGKRAGRRHSLLYDLILAPLLGLDHCLRATWRQDNCHFQVLAWILKFFSSQLGISSVFLLALRYSSLQSHCVSHSPKTGKLLLLMW